VSFGSGGTVGPGLEQPARNDASKTDVIDERRDFMRVLKHFGHEIVAETLALIHLAIGERLRVSPVKEGVGCTRKLCLER
jgi:hypothetical protein